MKVGPVDSDWPQRKVDLDDAEALERAARIVWLRKPRSLITAVACNVLNNAAREIRERRSSDSPA